MTKIMFLRRSFWTATRKCVVAKLSVDSKVSLQLSPGPCSFFDEPVHLKVTGLPPKQFVELRSKLTDGKGVSFQASATYCSNKKGQIDLDTCPSLGGSWLGIETMGLFSSMKPQVPHSRLTLRDMSMPLSVDIEVTCHGQVLVQQILERRFMADGVQKFPLEGGKIRGSLFVPPGQSERLLVCLGDQFIPLKAIINMVTKCP